jgi:hypothetical protein
VVIRFFALKELKSRVIHSKLESVSGREAPVILTVKKWRRGFHQVKTDLFDDLRSERPLTNDLVGAISFLFEERLLSSCKVLCDHFRIGTVTCLLIFHKKHGLKTFHLRRMPYALSINQKSERVSGSKRLLATLTEQQATSF